MQQRIQKLHFGNGVTLVSPENIWIEAGAVIGSDTIIEPFSWIGAGSRIGPGKHLPAGTILKPGSVIE
jgi:bifunctional UDP-N-acetylglucosamine pyrophosphorylase/glucosamine-1-phosphate N-acetyltransferase